MEVEGKKFEAARINYDGNRALSWRTLWYGPWMLDGILDGAADVSEHLRVLLDEHQRRWQGRPNYFYADSGSSAGKFLNRIELGEFSRWSVSYNKWTDKLDRLASELPESQWSALPPADQPQELYGKVGSVTAWRLLPPSAPLFTTPRAVLATFRPPGGRTAISDG